MKNYYGVDIPKQRAALRNSAAAAPLIREIMERAEAALTAEYTADTMSKYMEYYRTGHREDTEYFNRRNNAISLAMALWLTEDEKYLSPLVDVIYIICNEFTWCIPAHSHMHKEPTVDYVIHKIDLFQAETARALTEIAILLDGTLPYYVTERIEYELRRRIIDAYKMYPFFVNAEDQLNNWSAVCAGGAAMALLHFGTQEEIDAILPRLINGLGRYLEGLTNDGCCQEGVIYWNFGFGNYINFANLLYAWSEGKIDYIHNQKAADLALFPQRAKLNQHLTVSFSDAQPEFKCSPGLMCYLKKTYSGVCLPGLEHATNFINSVASITTLLWMDPDYQPAPETHETAFFPEAQWYISRKERFSFAAKGGHNNEPHNHNDLGSFMITVGNDIPLADLGAPEYVRYANLDDRFVKLNFSSHGHSVPIINGRYQGLGREYRSEVKEAGENVFSLDLQGAYPKGLVKRVSRSFRIHDGSVSLKDAFEFANSTDCVTERFVTWTKPVISAGSVDLGTAEIHFDAEKYIAEVSVDHYNAHRIRPNAQQMVTVYLIDITAKDPGCTEFAFEINIKA